MRIAFLTHEPFYPPSGGGSAEAIYLVQEMVRRGHEVDIFCPKIENPLEVASKFGVRLHEFTAWQMGRYAAFRNLKYLAYPFFLQRMVRGAAIDRPFDLVFSQHAIAAVAAGRLRNQLGCPVVMNCLDYLTAFMETWPAYVAPPPLLAILKRFELSLPQRYHADAVLTVSDTLADYFAQTGFSRSRILPIYYGYDADLFPLRTVVPPAQPPIVIMHGSLDKHHLQQIAQDAIAIVAADRPETIFRFVGHVSPTLQQFLARTQTRCPNVRLETTGFIPYDRIAAELAKAHLGIVPYEESTGTHCAFVAKIVEYLAVGLPVVSTRLRSASQYFANESRVSFTGFSGNEFGTAILQKLSTADNTGPTEAAEASARVRMNLNWRSISARALDFSERAATQFQR